MVYQYGPVTSRQANERFVYHYRTEDNLNQFRALLTHLQNMDVIQTIEKVVCPISKMTVYNFDVTGRLPVKERKVSLKDKKRDMLATVDRIEPWLSNFALSEVELLKQQINNL